MRLTLPVTLVAALAIGVLQLGGVQEAHGRSVLEPSAREVPNDTSAAGDRLESKSDGPWYRSAAFLREQAKSISSLIGIPVAVYQDPSGLVCLRAGEEGGPIVLVVPPTTGSGFSPWLAPDAEGSGGETGWDQRLLLAMDGSFGLLRTLGRDKDALERLGESSLLIVLGPGEQLAEAIRAESSRADGEGSAMAAFDLNFPWRWDEARRVHGEAAGPYPASRIDVLSLSELLLASPSVACVVRSTPTPVGPHAAPGSFATFVKGRLQLPHRSPPTAEALATEVAASLGELAELSWSKPVWRRLDANSWVVDLVLKNIGFRPTGPSQGVATELRLPTGIELGTRIRGESYRWLACGAAPLAPAALQDSAIRRGLAKLPGLAPGDGMRVRLLLGADGTAAGGPPHLDVTASTGRGVDATILGLTPPSSR